MMLKLVDFFVVLVMLVLSVLPVYLILCIGLTG